jgi:hypothetical protein
MYDPSDFRRPGQLPLQNPEFTNPGMFDPYIEHVWSLCDGQTPVDQIIASSRLGADRTLSVLVTLRRLGAIVLAIDSPDTVAERVAEYQHARSEASGVHFLPEESTTRIARGTSPPPIPELRTPPPEIETPARPVKTAPAPEPERVLAAGSVNIEPLSSEEVGMVSEATDLSPAHKHRAIAMWRIVGRGDPHEVLGVEPGATSAELRTAFRARCKEFHPDQFYGRNLGSFSRWLGEIFDGVQAAYDKLSVQVTESGFQTKREHAAELFKLACRLEVSNQLEDALRLFTATCRVDPRPMHLRRAARCALAVGDTDLAETWVRKAIDISATDPSTLRVLADVYRSQDRLVRAEVVLKRAIELSIGNESLAVELRRDLERVQQWLRG